MFAIGVMAYSDCGKKSISFFTGENDEKLTTKGKIAVSAICLDILSACACIFGIVAIAISFKAVPVAACYTLIAAGGLSITAHSIMACILKGVYLEAVGALLKSAFCCC